MGVGAHRGNPAGTRCVLEAAQRPQPMPAPVARQWKNCLRRMHCSRPRLPEAAPGDRRYLWLRVTLSTESPQPLPR